MSIKGECVMKYVINGIRLLFLALFIFLLVNGKAMLWLGLFGVSLIAALFFGRVYCGYVCPMNTVMIPADKISKKIKLQSNRKPKWLKNGYFAWIALIISAAAMIILKRFLHIDLPFLPIWAAIAFIVTLFYKPAVFHNLICPFGALQRLFGRFARRSFKVEEDACIGCKKCEKVCPSNSIVVLEENKKAIIDKPLCHQCTNCAQVCPTEAICYKKY